MLRRQRDYQFFSLRGALHEQMVSRTSNEQMLHVQRKDAARAMSSPCTCRDKTLHVQLKWTIEGIGNMCAVCRVWKRVICVQNVGPVRTFKVHMEILHGF